MKYICVGKDSKDVYVYLENQQKILRKVKEIRMRIKRVEMDEGVEIIRDQCRRNNRKGWGHPNREGRGKVALY